MKALIVGYGSAGQKHFKSIKKIQKVKHIKIFSSLNVSKKYKIEKKDIPSYNPDYAVIANSTKKHFEILNFLNNKLNNKLILVEKPIFHKKLNFKQKNKNKIFVGYNLRFNPVVNYLKNSIKNKKINHININCRSNLKTWRKNIEYSKSNTAEKRGGGALLELSHELDYFKYIFGEYKIVFKIKKKLSNLKIKNEDFYQLNGFSKNIKFFNIYVNLFDQIKERRIDILTNSELIVCDLNKNIVKIIKDNKTKIIKLKKINTFDAQHQQLLSKNYNKICKLHDGLNVLKIIDSF
jgi:predicted dehydrogenase